MTNKLKSLLFRVLKLDAYLSVIQKVYVLSYRSGLLKKSKAYQWHYFAPRLVQPGDTVIDLGANLGYFTLAFMNKVRPNGHLYCVEPVAPFQARLKKLIAGQPQVTLLPYALGQETDKPVTLGIPAAFQQLGYLRHGTTTLLHGGNRPDGKYAFEATMKQGSRLFADLRRLDYIKCDIEGYETVVFPEMKAVLQKHQPIVQLETWGEQLQTMYSFFKELGYDAFYLANALLKPLESKPSAEWGDSDILFVPPQKQHRIQPFLAQ